MSQGQHAEKFAPPSAARDGKPNLVGLDRDQLADALSGLGLAPFRTKQVWHWIYNRGVTDFAEMTSLAKDVREQLSQSFVIDRPTPTQDHLSTDGTRKWLMRMGDGQEIESVFIPETDRGTLCVSSQVGCTLTCKFCHTGTQRLVRNLSPAEIIGQIMFARDQLGDWPSAKEGRHLTNIVMMGMGEPLYNFENVKHALSIALDQDGVALSKRRITLSTAGVVPMMDRCGAEIGVNLAVSLHAVTNEVRDHIVPVNKKYPIKELLDACRRYPGVNNARRITFEYVMLDGVNDSDADARQLVKLLKGIPAKLNLIPFNAWPGAPFTCSAPERIERFAQIVMDAGYSSPVRRPRGSDIMAACGQLKSESVRAARQQAAALGIGQGAAA